MTQENRPHDLSHQFCNRCGSRLDPGTNFCGSCGAPTAGEPEQSVDLSSEEFPQREYREYMGFWIRGVAILIDWVIILVLIALLSRIFGTAGFFAAYAFWALYLILLTTLYGQTLGKMVLGIQVVDSQGKIPGLGRVLLREIVGRFISGLPLYLGFAWVAWDREKRGWHDHIAGTFVIRKERERVL